MAVPKKKLFLCLPFLVFFAAGGKAFAQAACTLSGTPAVVRSQGLTERTGSVVLSNCSGTLPTGVTLSVMILPGSAVISNNPAEPPTAVVSTTSGGVTSASAPIGAISVSGNVAIFSLPATPAGSTLASIQIGTVVGVASTVAIRVNASASGVAYPDQISASLSVSGGTLAMNTNEVTVAVPEPALFASTTPGNSIFQGAPPDLTSAPQTAAFSAGATPGFTAVDPLTSASVEASSIPVASIQEGFASALLVADSPPGGNGEGSDAVTGTRLLIRLSDLPTNIAVYAPQQITTTTPGGNLTLALVAGADSDGAGGAVLASPSATTASLVSGNAITYEAINSNTTSLETADIPLGLFTTGTPGAGTVSLAMSLAPVSTAGTASSSAPIPRFADVAAIPAGMPTMALSFDATSFTVPIGSTISPRTLAVTNVGGGVLDWTTAITSITGGDWLALSPASGTGDGNISLSVNAAGLAVGTYTATVSVSSPDATNSPQTLSVTLQVVPTALVIQPSSLSFRSPVGTNPAPQQLSILTGGGILNWTAAVSSSGGNWLSLSSSSGATPASVNVLVNTAGLSPGNYEGTITVSAPGASNNSQTVIVSLVLGTPVIALHPTSLLFVTSAGANPPPQTFTVQNSGAGVLGWTASAITQSGGDWLSVSPSAATAPSTLTVSVNSAALVAGAYTATIIITALPGSGAANSPQELPVTLAVSAPAVAPNAIVNGASYSTPAMLSPGSIASIFGSNLATGTAQASSAVLPITLAGTEVLVNGFAAPLFYVSPAQINFEVPPELVGTAARIAVISNGVQGTISTANLVPAEPGIFSANSSGSGQGAVLNQDSSVNSAQNPAAAGSVIQIYATGLGATEPPAVAGQPAPASPHSMTVISPVVLINGVPAKVTFSGLAPGFVGVYQINARIPSGTPAGSAIPLQIQAGPQSSNTVTIAVQ